MADFDRWAGIKAAYGEETFEKIKKTRVLVIGAGGIGCELLKNLVLTGFHDIEIADLDTIDVSNLNRQFLFQRKHVGQPKAVVARESALKYNPDAKIVAHHADVKSADFGPSFVGNFQIVLNALDNLPARRHVNRICWATGVPLVESGSAGWLGQVQPLVPKLTGCFECVPKPAPQKHPFCTIRNNPSKPIHCIVWAKMLFARLFGKEEDQQDAVTELDDPENREVGEAKTDQSSAPTDKDKSDPEFDAALQESKKRGDEEEANAWERWLFHKVFHTDILQLASLKSLWKKVTPPMPFDVDVVLAGTIHSTPSVEHTERLLEDQKVWDLKHCAEVFLRVAKELKSHASNNEYGLQWDKDEELHLDFVTAASNLRSAQFSIPTQSKFTIKSEAGNIIPAIATTNAIVAALIVTEAVKIVSGNLEALRQTFIMKQPTRKRILLSSTAEEKNPECYVCSSNFVKVKVDTEKVLLCTFVQEVLRSGLNMQEPTIVVDNDIIFETGEDASDFAAQLAKPLSKLRIGHNTVLNVEDFSANFTLELTIVHAPAREFEDPDKPFAVIGGAEAKAAGEAAHNTTEAAPAPLESMEVAQQTISLAADDDEVQVIEAPDESQGRRKRSRSEEGSEDSEEKRAKAHAKKPKASNDNTQHDVIDLD